MCGEAVQDRAHAVLAHAEVQVAAGVTPAATHRALAIAGARAGRLEVPHSCQRRVRRGVQIGRAADERGQARGDRADHLARGDAGGHALGVGGKDGNVRIPVRRQLGANRLLELLREIGEGFV